jgi:hypothetical protein
MPPPQIAIEIAAPAGTASSGPRQSETVGGSSERATLLAACSAAAAIAECIVADSRKKPDVLALVFWRGPGRVHVEVGSASRKGPWATRDLEFGARDPAIERWRTAGYTVGLLAAEALTSEQPHAAEAAAAASGSSSTEARERNEAEATDKAAGSETARENTTPSPSPVAATPSPPAKAAAAAEPAPQGADSTPEAKATPGGGTRSHRWSIAAGGAIGPGLTSIRGGGFLRVSRAFAGPFATVALAYTIDSRDSQDVSAQWFVVSAGGGYELTTPWFALDLRGELVAEQLTTRITDAVSGRVDSQSRWVAGFCAGAELERDIVGPIGVLVGAETTVRTNGTDVQVGDAVRTSAPVADYLALFGVRAAFR